MDGPNWLNTVLTIGGVLGTAITAVATIFLWRVTKTLARETKRMAEASAQPHVVATIEPNRWSMMHADLKVNNTGNATAYDVQIAFEPPLEFDDRPHPDGAAPLQQISVLKPGQGLSSYISKFGPLLEKTFTVTVSWRRFPGNADREKNSYTLSMLDLKGVTQLGASDPLVQIAEQVKKIREDWQSVARDRRQR